VIIVTDTSPLRYLALIGEVELLPRLFGTVLCPAEVAAEATHASAPETLRRLIACPPAWLVIKSALPAPPDLVAALDAGEAAVIALAETAGADVLLMDERKGRRLAEARGLRVAGTLNIIAEAAARGWLDYDKAVARLRTETNFRVSDLIVVLARHHAGLRPN
jgi:predicted nucleic acid-binding protein